MTISRSCRALFICFLFTGPASAPAQEVAAVDPAAVAAIFERFDGTHNPGCAFAVSREGRPILSHAYGMADLEHGVPNTPDTVFEPGSVSKQFTAAATILLSLDGAISLDDEVRKYIPELPDYGEPVTIRHLLHHTSGLRDWGSVAGIEGWPRTTRVHTHTHMLDIASRQKSLNYRPGEYYSYTNTGYNLQAVLVERVSGMSFATFSKTRLFEPLGMTRTEWRDDFTRIVKDRAVAYRRTEDGDFHILMPFENVHGNGGLLTTVGDLLRWTRNLETGEVGGQAFLEAIHRQGVLNSGQQITYAAGLRIAEYRGVPEVSHSGSTAGYGGFLTRFPEQGIAVAVMCNVAGAGPGGLAHEVAELYLGDALTEVDASADAAMIDMDPERLKAFAGGYRDTRTGRLVTLEAADGALRMGRATLSPVGETKFQAANGTVLEFQGAPAAGSRPAVIMRAPARADVRLEPVSAFDPTPAQLTEYVGTFRSDEAEATHTIVVDDGALVVKDRYGAGASLSPAYADVFDGERGTYIFRRDEAGRVTALSVSLSRVWDMRFERLP